MTNKPTTLTPEAERMNLLRYGTTLADFTAIHILQAADADIVRKEANAIRARANIDAVKQYRNTMLRYAFPRSMVEKARSAVELLEMVCKKPPTAKTRDEALLYDKRKLNEALKLARARADKTCGS